MQVYSSLYNHIHNRKMRAFYKVKFLGDLLHIVIIYSLRTCASIQLTFQPYLKQENVSILQSLLQVPYLYMLWWEQLMISRTTYLKITHCSFVVLLAGGYKDLNYVQRFWQICQTHFWRKPESLGHDRTSSLCFLFMWTSFWTYRRDAHPSETDIKGRHSSSWTFLSSFQLTDRAWNC